MECVLCAGGGVWGFERGRLPPIGSPVIIDGGTGTALPAQQAVLSHHVSNTIRLATGSPSMDQVNLAIQRVCLFTNSQVCLPGSVHASGMCGQFGFGAGWSGKLEVGRERGAAAMDRSSTLASERCFASGRLGYLNEAGAPAPVVAYPAPCLAHLTGPPLVAGCWPEPGGQATQATDLAQSKAPSRSLDSQHIASPSPAFHLPIF